jgi:hypothetical protein
VTHFCRGTKKIRDVKIERGASIEGRNYTPNIILNVPYLALAAVAKMLVDRSGFF